MENELELPDPDDVKTYDFDEGTIIDVPYLIKHLESLNEVIRKQDERIKKLEDMNKLQDEVNLKQADVNRSLFEFVDAISKSVAKLGGAFRRK